MKIIRDYLTSDEINFIVNETLKKTTSIEREIVKVGIIVQMLYEDIGEYKDCMDIYDKVMAEHIDISKEVFNYSTVETILAQETSTTKVVTEFLIELDTKLTELSKNIDETSMTNLINQLKETKNA